MSYTLTGKLVVAISSRALFDFEEENRIFESTDDSAYMKLQLERLATAAQAGVAFPLVKKLLAFNEAGEQRVEVVILSRNDPVSGLRVFRSAEHHGLHLERAADLVRVAGLDVVRVRTVEQSEGEGQSRDSHQTHCRSSNVGRSE